MRLAAAALALVQLSFSPPAAPDAAPEAEPPAPGRFLVATERIRGSMFRESVVFLLNYGPAGALGLIVNRPTELPLGEVVRGVAEEAGRLHLGGPVAPSRVMVLLRSDGPADGTAHVAQDVFMTVDPAVLREQASRADPVGRVRAYAGHAGWTAGQLDGEIARGDWLVVSAPTAAIFDEDPGGLWQRLFRRHHRLIARAPRVGDRRRAGR